MIETFKQIISAKNVRAAYMKLAEQMEADGRSRRYRGWDGRKLSDLEMHSHETVETARHELANFIPPSPALSTEIPKRGNPNKLREIFIYRLLDRIKAQAIHQVIEPYFDAYLSPWLFSYRSTHPTYHAARSTVRHYLKYCGQDQVLVADVSDYTKNILQDVLLEKIRAIGFDDDTMKLIAMFIYNESWRRGQIGRPKTGLVSGTPLISLFYNIYLDNFDKFCGPRVDFYRRVGDDLIMFDKNPERIELMGSRLLQETEQIGIAIHENKSKRGPAGIPFTYLGYRFENGGVGLGRTFWNNTLKSWQEQFHFHAHRGQKRKQEVLKKIISRSDNNLKQQFRQLAEQKKLITDPDQIKSFSEDFFKVLTKFFFGSYSARHRRLLKDKLKDIKIVSPYRYFWARKYSYGKSGKRQ